MSGVTGGEEVNEHNIDDLFDELDEIFSDGIDGFDGADDGITGFDVDSALDHLEGVTMDPNNGNGVKASGPEDYLTITYPESMRGDVRMLFGLQNVQGGVERSIDIFRAIRRVCNADKNFLKTLTGSENV